MKTRCCEIVASFGRILRGKAPADRPIQFFSSLLENVVRPNVHEFHTHYADLRHAHNAVSAVDALAAHLHIWAKQNGVESVSSGEDDSHFRNKLAERCPDFRWLRDIAKAQKHVHLTLHAPLITRADQIVSRTIGYGEGNYGEGHYGGVQQVVIDIAPSDFVYLENTIDNALAFLETEMNALGCTQRAELR